MGDLARFGYAWKPGTEASAEDLFRADLLRVIDLLRGLGTRGTAAEILDPAPSSRSTRANGDREVDGAPLTEALRRAAQDLLEVFPQSLGAIATSQSARDDFFKNHGCLRRAARDRRAGAGLESSGRRCAPCAYRTAGPRHRRATTNSPPPSWKPRKSCFAIPARSRTPEPNLTALVRGAQEILVAYDTAKRAAGLIDYADMIAEAEMLLRTRPEIRDAVLAEIDCVVIDEFQDTKPRSVRPALAARPRREGSADRGRHQAVHHGLPGSGCASCPKRCRRRNPASVDPLDRNWRSDPRIMRLVNALGPAIFDHYDPLAPTRDERPARRRSRRSCCREAGRAMNRAADCIADRVATLLAEEEEVWGQVGEASAPHPPRRHRRALLPPFRGCQGGGRSS